MTSPRRKAREPQVSRASPTDGEDPVMKPPPAQPPAIVEPSVAGDDTLEGRIPHSAIAGTIHNQKQKPVGKAGIKSQRPVLTAEIAGLNTHVSKDNIRVPASSSHTAQAVIKTPVAPRPSYNQLRDSRWASTVSSPRCQLPRNSTLLPHQRRNIASTSAIVAQSDDRECKVPHHTVQNSLSANASQSRKADIPPRTDDHVPGCLDAQSRVANLLPHQRKSCDREAQPNRGSPSNSTKDVNKNRSEDKTAKLPPHLRKFYAKHVPEYGKAPGQTANTSLPLSNTEEPGAIESNSDGEATTDHGMSATDTKPDIGQAQESTAKALPVISNVKYEATLENTTCVIDEATRETFVSLPKDSIDFGNADAPDTDAKDLRGEAPQKPLDNSDQSISCKGQATKYVPSTYEPDIRGEEPREIWDNQDWDAPRRIRPKRKEWESESQASDGTSSDGIGMGSRSAYAKPTTFLHRYVECWLRRVPELRCELIKQSCPNVYENHGINPMTGQLMEVIEAPVIQIDPYEEKNNKLVLKREKQSSSWSVELWGKMMTKANELEAERQKREEHARQIREMVEAKTKKGNPFLCRTPAHFRPAVKADMDEVARIYNREVTTGHRALDQDQITVQAFQNHFQRCKIEKIPFIVAMSEYRDPNVSVEEVDHRLIGFAFLDVASRGVFGSTKSSGKHSARMYVIVSKPFRDQRVGTALIDRMLIMTSCGYLEKQESYQWINPQNDSAYFPESRNPRKWRTILMDVYIENLGNVKTTHDGQEYKFVSKWLTLDFLFHMVNYTSNFGISDRHHYFLDRAMFEHRCHDSDLSWDLQG